MGLVVSHALAAQVAMRQEDAVRLVGRWEGVNDVR